MTDASTPAHDPQPVERFKPTSGQALGWVGIGAAILVIAYTVLFDRTVTGLQVILGTVFFGTLIYITQLRPRATAYPQHVVLKNAVRDAHVPLAAVDEVSMGQTLNVWSGDKRYVCIGIGNTMRADFKARRRRMVDDSNLGTSRFSEMRRKADLANLDERAMTYQTFVLTRLEELVDQAKREHAREDRTPPPPQLVVAWPEVALLTVSGVLFVLSLFL